MLRDARRLTREQPQLLAWVVGQWADSASTESFGQRRKLRDQHGGPPFAALEAIAVLVASLGEAAAAVAFRNLAHDALIEVGLSVHRQTVVARQRQREVLLAYLDAAEHYVVLVDDPQAFLHTALERAVGGAQARRVQTAIAARNAKTLADLLQSLSLEAISEIIKREPPQVAAAILGQLEAPRAAALCRLLDEAVARDLTARLDPARRLTHAAQRQLHEGLVRALNASDEMDDAPGKGSDVGNAALARGRADR